ncbi:relaxase/mobilization nuclease domain-containing protein [Pleurocapsa sp. PCC 7319]|uniref:relaxase/mobilization nuclease domain-containing protein n=1 Tax=Pleurocapsa sp. PCC 7319 TaxID=118161 RepID=UPI0003455474|nr:relaxase/mobilization nuclease domain-containing protein [Pleurocapsa sp. PCC 7319]
MIGKVTTGSSFDRLFRYLLKDNKQARIMGGERVLLEPDAKELASQFDWIASTRPTTKKPVKHLSIGFAPADGEVDDSTKLAISESIVNKLGYTNNQWVAIAHGRNDPGHDWQHDHDHLHIVINGIDFNGNRVSDSFDKTRLEQILRGLEAEHKLTKVVSSHECDRQRPKTKQLQRYQRESRKYPDTAPEIPIMAKLEAAIGASSRDKPTMTTFIGRMQQLGIDVRPYITEKGRKRISYRLGDFKVRGSKLHNGSFPKLLSERGIDFDEIRDTPALEAAYQGRSVEIDNKQFLDWEQIDLYYWLPQPLKALANVHLVEKVQEIADPKQWNNLQKTLLARYGIPERISAGLNEADLLDASAEGEPIWHKQSLLGSKDSHFWFEIGGTGNRAKKMIVTNSPVEAISAYLVDRLVDQEDCPCLYLSLDRLGQLTELDLTKFNSVVVNNSDKKLVSDSVRGLVIQKDVSSWQQSWLAHWNKVETILKSEAKNNNTLSERKPSNCKQLEL